MENFVEKVSRRKLKSLLHGKAWPLYKYNQHANSSRGENFYVGSKKKPKNLRNLRGHSKIISKPRSSGNFNFNHIGPRVPRHKVYNTTTDELVEFGPLFLEVTPRPNAQNMEEVILDFAELLVNRFTQRQRARNEMLR